MGRWGGKHNPSAEAYHNIPKQWQPEAVISAHQAMGGAFDIASTPRQGGHSWYRPLWYNLADGVRTGDAACIELAVRFIEAHIIVSYSGFTRTRMARALKNAALSAPQRARLSAHFLKLLRSGEKCQEFSEYLRLWARVINASDRSKALEIASRFDETQQRFRTALEKTLSVELSQQG